MNLKKCLQAVELLWDSLQENENKIESLAWLKDVLRKRKEKISNNDVKFISLNELKARRNLQGLKRL